MNFFSHQGMTMFEAGRKIYNKDTMFSVVNYRKLKRILKSLWKDTANIARLWSTEDHGPNTLVYFPHRLLKQQTKDYMSACKDGYTECNLDGALLVRIQEIEAEVHKNGTQ